MNIKFNNEQSLMCGRISGLKTPKTGKSKSGISFLARQGSGPTVVFLHGIGSSALSFLPILDFLPGDLNVILWNAPGYSGSDPEADRWPVPETYADRLCRFLDDLELPSVHLIGHSLGTLIAAAFARKHPARLKSLVLASSAQGYGVPKGAALPDKARARLDDLKRLGPRAFAKSRSANLVHDPDANPSLVKAVETVMSDIDPVGYAQAVHLLASGTLSSDLAQVSVCPGFIIGAQDKITPIEQTKQAARAWEMAHGRTPSIYMIKGAGHAVYLQATQNFCAAVMALMQARQHKET